MTARAILAAALVSLLPATVPAQSTSEITARREAIRHYRSGQELLAAERFDRAAEEFALATRQDPLFTLAFYFLGQAYVGEQRYEQAVKAYRDCIEACRGVYALRLTDRFEAERRRTDEIRELRETVALAQMQSRQSVRAVQLEQQLHNLEQTRRPPEAPFQPPAEVLLALGSALYHQGAIDQAEFEWRAAVEVNPKLGEAHNNLAVLLMHTDRLADASRELDLAERCGTRVNPQLKKDLKAAMNAKR